MEDNGILKLNAVKNVLRGAVLIIHLQCCLPAASQAQDVKPSPAGDPRPSAVTLSAKGKCGFSLDGVTFAKLEQGQLLEQGAMIRTGEGASTDLFFRRTGTTVRLQPATEIKLETMDVAMSGGLPVVHTSLDLRAGRIFTVVRSAVPGSTFEIKNAAGRSVVEGSGVGRYIITADGTHVTAKGSAIPLKVIGENGITIVAAGQQFNRKDGKMLPANSSEWVKELIQLDEVQAADEDLVPDTRLAKP